MNKQINKQTARVFSCFTRWRDGEERALRNFAPRRPNAFLCNFSDALVFFPCLQYNQVLSLAKIFHESNDFLLVTNELLLAGLEMSAQSVEPPFSCISIYLTIVDNFPSRICNQRALRDTKKNKIDVAAYSWKTDAVLLEGHVTARWSSKTNLAFRR